MKALSALVVADLWTDLDAETREAQRTAPKTRAAADLRLLEVLVFDRLRGVVEREAPERRLREHALSPVQEGSPWGLVATGEAGAGKSSLFARVYQDLARREDVLLLGHGAGISVGAGQPDRMLRRWIGELSSFLGVPHPVPEEEPVTSDPERREMGREAEAKPLTERLDEAFSLLLFQAARRKRTKSGTRHPNHFVRLEEKSLKRRAPVRQAGLETTRFRDWVRSFPGRDRMSQDVPSPWGRARIAG